MKAPILKNKIIKINIKNYSGSYQHYYHFLLGYLLPLVNWLYLEKKIFKYKKIFIEDTKVMNKHIKNVFPKKVEILSKDNKSEIFNNKTLLGFDNHYNYPSNKIKKSAKQLKEFLLGKKSFNLSKNFNFKKRKKVLVIDRGEPDDFYNSEECGIKGSACQRRSTPNLKNIKELLNGFDYKIVYLEDESLINQIKLFSESDFIIAQHGAALSNIIFCKKNTVIIEIRPDTKKYGNKVHFEFLSLNLGLIYFEIFQENNHSEVDINEILKIIKTPYYISFFKGGISRFKTAWKMLKQKR